MVGDPALPVAAWRLHGDRDDHRSCRQHWHRHANHQRRRRRCSRPPSRTSRSVGPSVSSTPVRAEPRTRCGPSPSSRSAAPTSSGPDDRSRRVRPDDGVGAVSLNVTSTGSTATDSSPSTPAVPASSFERQLPRRRRRSPTPSSPRSPRPARCASTPTHRRTSSSTSTAGSGRCRVHLRRPRACLRHPSRQQCPIVAHGPQRPRSRRTGCSKCDSQTSSGTSPLTASIRCR